MSVVSYYEQRKSVADTYISKQECLLQKPVYHIMPELLLRKVFLGVIYANMEVLKRRTNNSEKQPCFGN